MLLNLKHADLYKPEVCLVHFAVQVQFFSFSTTWLPSDLLLHGHCGNNRKNISIHLPTSWQLTQILAILAQMIPSCCSYLDVGCSSRTPDRVKETEKSFDVMFMSTLHMAGMSKTGPLNTILMYVHPILEPRVLVNSPHAVCLKSFQLF